MPPRCTAAVLALLSSNLVAHAQNPGWESGYRMGTSYAGVANDAKARLTFYCGDKVAARANPAIMGGPHVSVVLPKAAGLDAATAVELVVDGKATRLPVTAAPDGDMVDLTWRPGRDSTVAKLKPVVAALRKARTIEVKAAASSTSFTVAGAGKALADDPLSCS